MWYPNRENKKSKMPDRDKKVEFEEKLISLEERKKIKKEFFDKYIKNGELKEQMKGINSAQLSRFYSLLEDRNFYKDSNYIKKSYKYR